MTETEVDRMRSNGIALCKEQAKDSVLFGWIQYTSTDSYNSCLQRVENDIRNQQQADLAEKAKTLNETFKSSQAETSGKYNFLALIIVGAVAVSIALIIIVLRK